MPKIKALPPNTEGLSTSDVFPMHNDSTDDTEKVSAGQLLNYLAWTPAEETWSYSSWSSTTRTGVLTVPSDATTKYTPGMRIKISQSTGGTKYGIIQAVSATTLTVFWQSGATLANETVTNPMCSTQKTPFGFPADRSSWLLTFSTKTDRSVAAVATRWYKLNSTHELVVPIGSWNVRFKAAVYAQSTAGATALKVWGALSSGSTPSDAAMPADEEMTVPFYSYDATSNVKRIALTVQANQNVLLAAQTTYSLYARMDNAGTLDIRCNLDPTMIIEAANNYL